MLLFEQGDGYYIIVDIEAVSVYYVVYKIQGRNATMKKKGEIVTKLKDKIEQLDKACSPYFHEMDYNDGLIQGLRVALEIVTSEAESPVGYDNGFGEGYDDGFSEGFNEGFNDGY